MALIKDKETKFGVPANYHRIDDIKIDTNTKSVQCYVKSYLNQEARQNGLKELIKTEYFFFNIDLLTYADNENLTAYLYELVKQRDVFFQDAENDI